MLFSKHVPGLSPVVQPTGLHLTMYNADISLTNMPSIDKIKKYFDTGFYNKAISYFLELDEPIRLSLIECSSSMLFRLGEYHNTDSILQQAEPSLSIIQASYLYMRQIPVF